MSTLLFANNASAPLAAPLTTSATTVSISSALASTFPVPTTGQYFALTVEDLTATPPTREIMQCTANVAGTLTVVRAQEGTTATAFAVSATVSARITAGIMALLAGMLAQQPSTAMQPVVAASTTAAALTALGIPSAMQPVVSAASLAAAWALLFGASGETITYGSFSFAGATLQPQTNYGIDDLTSAPGSVGFPSGYVSMSGALLGDIVDVSFSANLNSVHLWGWVVSDGLVSVRFENNSGTAVTLSAGTIQILVRRPAQFATF